MTSGHEMPPKVLYIYEGKLTHHGIDHVVRQQLRALVENGFQVDLVSRGDPHWDGITFRGRRWTIANALSWLPRSIYYPAQKRVFMAMGARLIRSGGYEKIISWRDRALSALRIGSRIGIPCYLNHDAMHWSHAAATGSPPPRWPALSRAEMDEEYRLANVILLPSENSKSTFLSHVADQEKLKVIGRGVDTERFSPSPAKKDSVFRLVFCGRACERKGIRQVVEAWNLANLPSAELLVVGDIDKNVEDLVSQNSDRNIRWMGFQRDLPDLFNTCDAQILLSRREGMAKSLLEGAACGLATIATIDCGFPMLDGINGFLVSRENTASVAENLRFLHQNHTQCASMGKSGRETVVAEYSWEKFRERFARAIGIAV
ncbi:MAG: glycosyltransferase [Spartobacteria bacterium]|nr:glycosyltransferase [Spartobacteria bacterium]